ncbi:MAG: phenylalanine--tRNA ligase subunit beta [Kiritimatiellia bacterium]|nr:phenylalanine--tRNA ligase subunit beta [Kiritimatiellia bacterium]
MKIPLSWLQDFVDLSDLSIQDLSDKLTFSGIEVEGIETSAPALDEHFVVAQIRACLPHPDSDHLHVCTVFDGQQEWQVVCGAPNARTGLTTAFAKVGAVIPDGGFKIKKAKLRGVESFGMLCSKRELKVDGDHEGIWELDDSLHPGTLLQTILPKGETVFDLEITWNRPDCLSVRGIAREFAALLGRPLRQPEIDFPEGEVPVETLAAVRVEATDLCPRYTARIITGFNHRAPTPPWMQARLEQAGMRSLGLAVDVTNYVMLECGQPLHAFDYTTLADHTIVIRRAADGEQIKTLDGVGRKLDASMLLIADANRPVAVAGVMGGEETEITSETGAILIESALFDAPSIKRTATALGLASEASRRYERGVDPDLADWASRRAVHLLQKYGGGTVAKGLIDVDNRDTTPVQITLPFSRVDEVIGIAIPHEKVLGILSSLGLVLANQSPTEATFTIPSWRLDLTRPADLIEEVARINGLDAIPDRLPSIPVVSTLSDKSFKAKRFLRNVLIGSGLTEAMHYSFLSEQELDAFDPRDCQMRLVLPNPVSSEYGVMRPSLLPQMIGSLGRNASRQIECCGLFETGRVFGACKGHTFEEERLAIGLIGPFGRSALDRRRPVSNDEGLLWIKGILDRLAVATHAPALTYKNIDHPAMEPGFAAEVFLGKQRLGLIGAVSAVIRHKFRLTSVMVLAEIKPAALLSTLDAVKPIVAPPLFPAVKRDLALVAPDTVPHAAILDAIRRKAPKELTRIELFDIFLPKEMKKGFRSLAYSLYFQAPDRTLKDEEVRAAVSTIVATVKDVLGIEVREN